jgi:preprotein translocase subunit SecE
MSTELPATGGFFSQLLQTGFYKPTQGRVVRQVTFVALALVLVLAAWQLAHVEWLAGAFPRADLAFLGLFSLIGLWIAYRLVNYSRFADFLIAVEAELNKVSWPSRHELWRASLVVVILMILMALLLFSFDVVWTALLKWLGIRA